MPPRGWRRVKQEILPPKEQLLKELGEIKGLLNIRRDEIKSLHLKIGLLEMRIYAMEEKADFRQKNPRHF